MKLETMRWLADVIKIHKNVTYKKYCKNKYNQI